MKRLCATCLLVAFLFSLLGCGKTAEIPETTNPLIRQGNTIGISLPDENWEATASGLITILENAGYQTDLQYAQGSAQTQANHLRQMAADGVSCIVVAAVDPFTLAQTVDDCAEKGVKIIAYDRLITDSAGICYFVAPNYKEMGKDIAQKVADSLQKDVSTFELFMDNPAHPGARAFWEGVMEVLQPYIDNGRLKTLSGRLDFEDVCIVDGSKKTAQSICTKRLEQFYAQQRPDICITGSDTLAAGVIAALENAGYQQQNLPLTTGSGCYDTPVMESKLTYTAYTKMADLCQACLIMVDAAISGNRPATGQTLESTSNNTVSVPTYLCDYQLIQNIS